MEKRLSELIEKKFLTEDEIEELYLMENVYLDYNGYSGTHIGYYWYTVHIAEDEEYDVYSKNIF